MKKIDVKTLWTLFIIFFKAGTFTFAGGLAMLPVIENDIVNKNRLMSHDEFLEYATLSQTLPGVIALNCATFVGRHVAGTIGMLVAGLGATFSAFALMLVATVFLQFIPQQGVVASIFQCIRAASSALVLSAAFALGKHNIKNAFSIIIMFSSFVLVLFFHVSTPWVILFAGCIGVVYKLINRRAKSDV